MDGKMLGDLAVTFHLLNAAGGEREVVRFCGVPVVPAVGERCFVVTTRDGEGNYSSDGNPQRRWSGLVIKREFSYEMHGSSLASQYFLVYVDVYIDCDMEKKALEWMTDEEKAVAFLEGQGGGEPLGLIQSAAEGRLPGARRVGLQEDEENEPSRV